MAKFEIPTRQHAARAAAAYRSENAEARYRAILVATLPAAAILLAAATMLSRLIAG